MLTFNDVACRRDGVLLFDRVSLVIHAGQKLGLTGANGSGKSSLFALVLGELEADAGELSLQQQVTLAHVAQETTSSSRSALDYVIDGDAHIRRLESALATVAPDDGVRHASLLADFEQAGGYRAPSQAGSLLNGLGFATDQHAWPVAQFSGGWRMRLNLAQALMSPSELLLLDEPTNHLDLDAVLWLEQWLRQREGGLLLISHDREFLDRVITHTLHIEQQRITLYTGNYSDFERLRASRLANQQAMYVKQQQRRQELQGFVDRFRAKATKARQAQSRLKMLERMTTISPAHVDSPFRFSFRAPDALPSPLVVLREVSVGYDAEPVLRAVNLTVQSGDRVGLLGANGAGKSTLIKALVGDLEPRSGERITAQRLSVGYFAQHQVDQLRDDHTPLKALLTLDPTLADSAARNFLGGFGFQGEQVMQLARTLSGGERARLALALIVYQKPNLLLLDEPTNHLDIDMRQALAEALQGFAGALLVISHDRTLLRSVVDDLWLVADGTLTQFNDDLDGYARWLSEQRSQSIKAGHDVSAAMSLNDDTVMSTDRVVDRKERKREAAAARALLAPLKKAVQKDERELEQLTVKLSKIREKLASNELYNEANKTQLTELLNTEVEYSQAVDAAEERLLDSMQALELAESEQQTGAQ